MKEPRTAHLVNKKSMFASNTLEISSHQKNNREKEQKINAKQNVFAKLLCIHKKLKNIAQHEYINENKFKVAKLNPSELNEIKHLEGKLGYCCVAYEHDNSVEENKIIMLNKIDLLLDEYMKLLTNKRKTNTDDEFKDFFEQ